MHETKLERRLSRYRGDFDLSAKYQLCGCGGGGGEASAEERDLYAAQAKTARSQLANYEKYMPGALSSFAGASSRYSDPAYRAQIRGRAGADAQQAIAGQTASTARGLGRYGINPNSGRFAGAMAQGNVGNAATVANAQNKAGFYVDDMQLAASKDFANSLMGLSSNAAQGLSSAANGYASIGQREQAAAQSNMQGAGQLARLGMDAYGNGSLGKLTSAFGFAKGGDVDVEQLVRDEAVRLKIDPDLAYRMAHKESGLNPNARNRKTGAAGVLQMIPSTAKMMGVKDVHDPAQNIRGGLRYFKQQLDAHNGDVGLALASYNAGPGAVARYGGVPPYKETRNYIAAIAPDYDLPALRSSTHLSSPRRAAPTPTGAMTYDPTPQSIGSGRSLDTSEFTTQLPTTSPMLGAPAPTQRAQWQRVSIPAQPAYQVRSGDNLSNIARAHNMSLSELISLNPQYKSNPNLIRPGERINLGGGYAGGGLVGNTGLLSQQTPPVQNRAPQPSPLSTAAEKAGTVADIAKNPVAMGTAGLQGATAEALGSAGLSFGSEQAAMLAAQEAGLTGGLEAAVGTALPWVGLAMGVASLFMADGGAVSALEQYFQAKGWRVAPEQKKQIFESLFGQPYRGTPEEDKALLKAFVMDDADEAQEAGQWDRMEGVDPRASVQMANGGLAQKLRPKTSVVDAFKASGMDASFANRKRVFESMYGGAYKGTAEQNLRVLRDMQRVMNNPENPANIASGEDRYAKPQFGNVQAGASSYTPTVQPRVMGSPELEATFRDPGVQAVQASYPVENAVAGGLYAKGLGSLVGRGIDLTRRVNAASAANRAAQIDRAMESATPFSQLAFADGGRADFEYGGGVDGPGSATSDSVPAQLSDGEFVVNADAVELPGVRELLEKINNAGLQRRYGAYRA